MLDRRFEHVVAVAKAGSFTAAANLVGVTQSAVTKSIADLEHQVGYSIFVRTARGALLTEQGRDFVDRAQKLIEDAKHLLKRPQGDEDVYSSVLRIGVCPASVEFRLLEPISRLLKRHPSIRLEISGSNFERTVQLLRSGSIDVAVGFEAAFNEWPDLKRRSLPFNTTTYLFVRRGHPILERPDASIKDLADYQFVSPSDSRPYGAIIRGLYEDQDIDWHKNVHTIDFFPMVRKIVATTDAIGVVAETFAEESESFREQFAILESLNPFGETAAMCCAIRARWEPPPAVRALMSCLQRSARR